MTARPAGGWPVNRLQTRQICVCARLSGCGPRESHRASSAPLSPANRQAYHRAVNHRLLVLGALSLALLALSPLASARSHAAWWTLAQAKAVLYAPEGLELTDDTQADKPQYVLSLSARAVAVRPVGASRRIRGQRRWRQFSVSGTARDVVTEQDLAVALTFRPLSAPRFGRYRIEGFRGPPADSSQPAFPIRGAFFYGWYPEGWNQRGISPFTWYHPSLGYYDSSDPAVIRQQIAAMRYGNVDVGLYSWWTPNTGNQTDERFALHLRLARETPFRWAIVYEPEGYGDPTVDQLRADLAYFRDTFASKPAYQKINGRFVVFAYGDAGDSCATADRWKQANVVGAYVVLKAIGPAYGSCANQPDAWYEYSASESEWQIPPHSFMIAPGLNARHYTFPRFERNLGRWRENIRHMVDSHAPWQLVLTFNEWPEGTAVESAQEWPTPSGFGAYLDALHEVP